MPGVSSNDQGDDDAEAQERRAGPGGHRGTAGHIEADTEKGATYEVEVTKPDGSKVDVRMDGGFDVIAVDPDVEQTGEH